MELIDSIGNKLTVNSNRIYGINITDLVDEIIMKKNSHKEMKSLLYERGVLHSNNFELLDWTRFEHTRTRVTHFLQLWVIKDVYGICGEMK